MSEPPLSGERAAKRLAILQSAVETFAERGYFAARTREIAARAGVAEGTIYLYFDGKDDLLLTAFRERVGAYCESVEALLSDEGPFLERLTRFVEAQFEGIERQPALATVILLESRQSSRFYGEPVREVLRSYAAAVDRLLQSGVDRGEVDASIDAPLARRMLIGAVEEVELDWLVSDRSRPLSPLAPRVASQFYRGISASPAHG